MIDLAAGRYVRSLGGLNGVAGVWVHDGHRLLFTSNRGDDTASAFQVSGKGEKELLRVRTGSRPNGMAYDPLRKLWMVAGVGNPELPDAPPTLTFVDLGVEKVVGRLSAPGRTRWATYHVPTGCFYVNVADPASILAVRGDDLSRIDRTYPMPAKGPHGMEQDPRGELLYCACDDGTLLSLTLGSGKVERCGRLAGPPDVLWLDPELRHLYAATDEPATVEVFETDPVRHLETYPTAPGAHTLTVDAKRHQLHAFLPEPHEDLVLGDAGGS